MSKIYVFVSMTYVVVVHTKIEDTNHVPHHISQLRVMFMHGKTKVDEQQESISLLLSRLS